MDKKITYKDGKLIINSEEAEKIIKEQGIEFGDDGSLELKEGSNFHAEVSWG